MARGRPAEVDLYGLQKRVQSPGTDTKVLLRLRLREHRKAPSFELVAHFEEQRKALDDLCVELTPFMPGTRS